MRVNDLTIKTVDDHKIISLNGEELWTAYFNDPKLVTVSTYNGSVLLFNDKEYEEWAHKYLQDLLNKIRKNGRF